MSVRRVPRPVGSALRQLRARGEPPTLLAAVQGAWSLAAGDAIAREATPVAERDGVITVACRSSTWASELDLLQTELLERLNATLHQPESRGRAGPVGGLRFTADGARLF